MRKTVRKINWKLKKHPKGQVIGQISTRSGWAPRYTTPPQAPSATIQSAKNIPGLPVYDQFSLASCVTNTTAMALRYAFKKVSGGTDLSVSRMYMYYIMRNTGCYTNKQNRETCRVPSGDVRSGQKQGGHPARLLAAISVWGILPEESWKYPQGPGPTESTPFVSTLPAQSLVRATNYGNKYGVRGNGIIIDMVQSVLGVRQCIDEGTPVMICIYVVDDMFGDDGNIRVISESEAQNSHAAHALLISGYNDHTQEFVIMNSWGSSWGVNGYGLLSYRAWYTPMFNTGEGHGAVGYRIRLR